ncbi:MAG: hypothetical protein BMS9Abin13_057 [Patescibacteria group bacterium]|nr:MAG: hypothetical protein BMS9Abin13_057 [Patescibacteria group bacterium]
MEKDAKTNDLSGSTPPIHNGSRAFETKTGKHLNVIFIGITIAILVIGGLIYYIYFSQNGIRNIGTPTPLTMEEILGGAAALSGREAVTEEEKAIIIEGSSVRKTEKREITEEEWEKILGGSEARAVNE